MTYIIGTGILKVGDYWEKSLRNLAAEASILAIDDAGGVSVDYVVIANSLSGVVNGQENLGSYVCLLYTSDAADE